MPLRAKLPRIIDPKLKRDLWGYVWQVGLAIAALFMVLALEQLLAGTAVARAVLVAAIASTAFILFITPNSASAQPRNAIGGHMVGLAMFVMAATDTEHPAAAGTALAVASTGLTWQLALFLATSVVALSLIHVALRSRLRNLY